MIQKVFFVNQSVIYPLKNKPHRSREVYFKSIGHFQKNGNIIHIVT